MPEAEHCDAAFRRRNKSEAMATRIDIAKLLAAHH